MGGFSFAICALYDILCAFPQCTELPIMVEMILGLPHLRKGPLLSRARELGVPVLVSANAFAVYRKDKLGIPYFDGFDGSSFANASGMNLQLDSGGFSAMRQYSGWPWGPQEYITFASSLPVVRFYSMDYCVEPEVAASVTEVHDRISRTVRLNVLCRNLAIEAGSIARFAPVVQGWLASDYGRCIERMPWLSEHSVVGIGSFCRRQPHGPNGVLQILSHLDRWLPANCRVHLFGLHGEAMELCREHPRVISVDSQAWGKTARWEAFHIRRGTHGGRRAEKAQIALPLPGLEPESPVGNPDFKKTDAYCANVMAAWMNRQTQRLKKGGFVFQEALPIPPPVAAAPKTPFEVCIERAKEEIRQLIEDGEMEHDQITENLILAWAADLLEDADAPDQHLDATCALPLAA